MKRILACALIVMQTSFALAGTSASRELARIQKEYLQNGFPYPVLLMDRDELEWRFARAGARDEAHRVQVIRDYVHEKTGVTINENAAINFEPYLSLLNESAVAMPAFDDDFDTIEMCAVFPPDPNRNQRLEIERLLQLQVAEAYGPRTYEQFKARLSYDDLVLFSTLHEVGHCLDQTFFARVAHGDSDPYSIHQSEAFAETVGAFLMAREGRSDVVSARTAMRTTYAYFMEPFFVHHPENGLGNESYLYGGLIYFLAPVLEAVGVDLKADPTMPQRLTLAQILERSRTLVTTKDLPSRLFTAIYAAYAEGREVALDRYEQYARDYPDLFGPAWVGLQKYLADEDRLKPQLFESSPVPPEPGETPLLVLDEKQLCVAFKAGDREGYEEQVEKLRRDLQTGVHEATAQRERSTSLRDLWKRLPVVCN